jgi:pimeloyl-ACP methyl ester carboxylesterase
MRDWGYVSGLRDHYQLVLVDARGHGRSDKPHVPDAYRLELMATDVVVVLDDLNIDKAHFFGYSMGAEIGWGLIKYAPERFYSFIVGGGGPRNPRPGEESPWIELYQKGMEATAAAVKPAFGKWWTPELEVRILANDAEALIACQAAFEPLDFEEAGQRLTVPCLVIYGEHDPPLPLLDCAERMPTLTFASLPGLDHFAILRCDMMLPHLRKFLAEVGEG